MLKDFYIKPVLTTIKNPQAKNPVEWVHQVILNMLVTKYLDNKVFNYKYPWCETLAPILWTIRVSYPRNIHATPGKAVFVRDMIFNLVSVVDCQVITTMKHRQVGIDNFRESSRQVMHDYEIGVLVYVKITGIYR